MNAIQLDNIESVVPAVMHNLDRLHVTDVAYNLQSYPFARQLLQKRHVKIVPSGSGVNFQLKVNKLDTAEHTGVFATADTSTGDLHIKGSVPWRMTRNHWIYDLLEISQKGPEEIVDVVKERRIECLQNLLELVETSFLGKPATSSDTKTPYGIPYWIVKSSASEGFYGGNPSGFSQGAAGIDADTYPPWNNYQAEYAQITKADIIAKMKKAAYKTDFRAVIPIPDQNRVEGTDNEWFSNYNVKVGLETLAEDQNDRLGTDLDSMAGRVRFQGNPVTPVPYLDSDSDPHSDVASTDPLFGINWNTLQPCIYKGWDLVESKPKQAAHQPTVRECWVHLVWQIVCTNRRKQVYIAKAAS